MILLIETRIIIARFLTLIPCGLNQSGVNGKLNLLGFVVTHLIALKSYNIQLDN